MKDMTTTTTDTTGTTRCNRWTLCCPESLKANSRHELKTGMLMVEFVRNINGTISVTPYEWSDDRLDWKLRQELVVVGDIHVPGIPCVLESARTIWRTLMSIGYDIHHTDRSYS
jgi:hypothetical protein